MARAPVPRPRRGAVRLLLLAATATTLLPGCRSDDVFQLAGTVERTTLEITAPISEVIVDLPVEPGDRVSAGEVVVALDSEVASAELTAFEAAVAAAQAMLREAEREFGRTAELSRQRVASAQQLDRARRARDEAVALVAEKEARIAQAKKRLRDLTLRSHTDGVVDQLPFEEGERVPAGAVVAVIQTDDEPWVRLWLPARSVARATSETLVEVTVEGFEHKLGGRLEDISREPEFTPHFALTERESAHLVYRARVVLHDAPADLRPGLAARVELKLPKRSATAG